MFTIQIISLCGLACIFLLDLYDFGTPNNDL